MELNDIPEPRVAVTDKEQVLLNALGIVFPDSKRVLCRWHILKNIELRVKPKNPQECGSRLKKVHGYVFDRIKDQMAQAFVKTPQIVKLVMWSPALHFSKLRLDFHALTFWRTV
jgi:hypothetical protein